MRREIPGDFKYVRNVMDLIYLADINYLVCEKIYSEIFNKTEKKDDGFLLLTANNCFFESVSILHTLLCSTKKEEFRVVKILTEILAGENLSQQPDREIELSKFLIEFSKDYPNPNYIRYADLFNIETPNIGDFLKEIRRFKRVKYGLKDLKDLKHRFESYTFHKIRHNAGAHKNAGLPFPAGAVTQLIKQELLENLGSIVKDLKILAYFWFEYEVRNPDGSVLEALEKRLSLP